MEYSDVRIVQLHDTLLELFDYFVEICKKNDLHYVVIAGTALGAYRNHGFIPWDDDLDVALPRQDYEKLIKVLHKENQKKYSVQDVHTEEKYFLPYAKIRKNGTVLREAISPEVYNNNGIFIDVFPIDYVNDANSIEFKIRAHRITLITHVLRFRYCRPFYRERRKRWRYVFDWLIGLLYSRQSNKKLLEKQTTLMKKDNNSLDKKYVINYASTYSWKKEIYLIENFMPFTELVFEGREVYAYGKVEKYLSQLFGDFLQIPPENERYTHEPLELKF